MGKGSHNFTHLGILGELAGVGFVGSLLAQIVEPRPGCSQPYPDGVWAARAPQPEMDRRTCVLV